MTDPHMNNFRETDPRERLLELSRQKGSPLARLSQLIGRNPTYLQQFIRKGSPRKLEEADRRILAEFFGVSETELGAAQDRRAGAGKPARKGDWMDVPRLLVSASAGPGRANDQEQPFDSFRFSTRWLREQGLEAAHLSAIAVEGDSMEPLLKAGDEVLVDGSPQPFRDGIHVVRLEDTLLVKRVAAQGGGRLMLLSSNTAYPPVEVAAEEIEIVGRVVWKSGRL